MKGFLLLFAVCFLFNPQLIGGCPSPFPFAPCRCEVDSIYGNIFICKDVQSQEQFEKAFSVEFQGPDYHWIAIRNTSISALPEGIFRSIKAKTVEITDNANLSNVDKDAFAGIEDSMSAFDIRRNHLQGVGIFGGLAKMKNLVYALLSWNSLSSVPDRAFAAMPELFHVELDHNRISSLGREAFVDCPKLRRVDLGNNELKVLPGRIFFSPGSGYLDFYLEDNQIDHVEHDAFDGMEKNIFMRLERNRLQTLPSEIFKPLADRNLKNEVETELLYLYDNPFVCDCRMRWILENPDYFKVLHGITCADTNELLESYSLENLGTCV